MNSSDIFAKAFENSRTGLLLLEKATGRVLEANPAFLRICRRPRGEVVGHVFFAPPLVADAAAGAEVFEHLRAGGSVAGAELPLELGGGGRLLLEVTCGDLDGGILQLEVLDATARAGARMALRVEAQRSLAARVAAEFDEIHQVLKTANDVLTNCARRGEAPLPGAGDIRRASDRAGAIVRDLQAYGGQVALEARPVPLNELIEDMQPALRQMLGSGIQMAADLGPDLQPVVADPAQVRQILLKMAANSAEAMVDGGRFRIATRLAPAGDPALERGSARSYAMLEVSDEGPGLDDESWEHLYEPFFTTKRNGKRGLGLAVVQGLVRRMGGRLWADSEPGKGTSFRIYLPLAQAGAVARPAEPPTILLMEQNEGLRTVVTNILKKRGYRVAPARATSTALEMAKTKGPSHLPGVAVTLSKPFELDALLGKVRELLEV